MTFPGLSSVLLLMCVDTGMTAHWTGQDLALIAVSGYLVDNTAHIILNKTLGGPSSYKKDK